MTGRFSDDDLIGGPGPEPAAAPDGPGSPPEVVAFAPSADLDSGADAPPPATDSEPHPWGADTPPPPTDYEPRPWGADTPPPATDYEPHLWGAEAPTHPERYEPHAWAEGPGEPAGPHQVGDWGGPRPASTYEPQSGRDPGDEPPEPPLNLDRLWTVARTDLRQLTQAKDFLYPMVGLGSLFYVVVPTILLLAITQIGSVEVVGRVSEALEALPASAESQIRGETPEAQTAYALAVFLFAPVAVIVPLTISTAVGAAALVGERERGTGEFLAHSPASVQEIYLGKLLASLIPGYVTVAVGFGAYSLLVNLIVGPSVGGWFFPTAQWWVMILWVLPPFLAICLSVVLRLSARVSSTAAAQQASGLVSLPLIMVAYSQATGVLFGAGYLPLFVGATAWIWAFLSLRRGMRAVRRDRLLSVASGI